MSIEVIDIDGGEIPVSIQKSSEFSTHKYGKRNVLYDKLSGIDQSM